MRAVQHMVDQGMSLSGALRTCEVSKMGRRRGKKTRVPRTDANLRGMILEMRKRRPFCGTGRAAAEPARRPGKVRRPGGLPPGGLEQAGPVQGQRQGPLEADQGGQAQPWLADRHYLRVVRAGRRMAPLLQHAVCLHQTADCLPVQLTGHCERRRELAGGGRRHRQTGLSGDHHPV